VDTVAEIAELERQAEALARQRSSAGGDLIHRGYHQRAVEDAEESELRWRVAELVAAVLDTGMTQRDLAAKLGRSQSHVSFMLRAWTDYLGNDDRPLFAVAYAAAKQRVPEPTPGNGMPATGTPTEREVRQPPVPNSQNSERHQQHPPVIYNHAAVKEANAIVPTRRRLALNKVIRASGFDGYGWDLRQGDRQFTLSLTVLATTDPEEVERFLASDVCAQLVKLAQAAREGQQ
jgi:hypothetical protein